MNKRPIRVIVNKYCTAVNRFMDLANAFYNEREVPLDEFNIIVEGMRDVLVGQWVAIELLKREGKGEYYE